MLRHDFGVLFWFHAFVVGGSYASPLLLNVQIIALGALIFWLQVLLLGGCLLTRLQFPAEYRHKSFHVHCLEKLGFSFDRKAVDFFVDRIVPFCILVLAMFWQKIFGHPPLLF